MRSLTCSRLRAQARQFLAPALAVLLGVAFVTVSLILAGSLAASLTNAIAGEYGRYAVVARPAADGVTTGPGGLPSRGSSVLAPTLTDAVRAVPGVRAVHPVRVGAALLGAGTGDPAVVVLRTPPSPYSPATLSAGRWPQGTDELAVSKGAAAALRLEPGGTATLTPIGAASGASGASRASGASGASGMAQRLRVVGVVDTGPDPNLGGGRPVAFGTAAALASWTGAPGWSELDVEATDGTDPEVLRQRVAGLVTGAEVLLATQVAAERVRAFTQDTDLIGGMLLGFAGVSAFVSALVIANTYAILLARRRRETALVRALGARRGQVIGSALAETAVLGVVASAFGVGLGLATAAVLLRLGAGSLGEDRPPLVLAVRWFDLVGPFGLGVVVVVVAALLPVLRAARVAPLEALRPVPEVAARSRGGVVRIGLGLVLLAAGGAALVLGMRRGSVVVGMAGGAISFLGVMLAGRLLVPGTARLIGLLTSRFVGVPGRLAVANAVRNPARAASTSAALLIGVTLITTMAVGNASLKATALRSMDGRYAVDLTVRADADLPAATRSRIAGLPGVRAGVGLPGTTVRTPDGGSRDVVGIGPGALAALRNGRAVDTMRPGTLVVAPESALAAGTGAGTGALTGALTGPLTDGGRIRLVGPSGTLTLRVRVSQALGLGWAVHESDLRRLDATAAPRAMLLLLADDADPQRVVDGATDALNAASVRGQVRGDASDRAELIRVLDIVLAVVIALLAISVLIAVVGIANTLSLSVHERTGESALMRALGLTRGQLRRMLALEALLLAAVAVAIGTALGLAYGLAGAVSLYGGRDVVEVVPWPVLAAVAAGALTAALVAGVGPARRAAAVPPAAALAAGT